MQAESPTFVDVDDSKAIATAFTKTKLKLTPPAHIVFVAALFNYSCMNLHPSIINAQVPQIFANVLERAWMEMEKAPQLNDEQWGDLSTFIDRFFSSTQ